MKDEKGIHVGQYYEAGMKIQFSQLPIKYFGVEKVITKKTVNVQIKTAGITSHS